MEPIERYCAYLKERGNEASTIKSKVGLVKKYGQMGARELEKAVEGNSLSSKTKIYKALADYKEANGLDSSHEKSLSRTYSLKHNIDYMIKTRNEERKEGCSSWDSILAKRDAYIQKHLRTTSRTIELRILLISLYTQLPPLRLTDYKQLYYADNGSNNYLQSTSSGLQLVMRNYKTAKKYGTNVIPLPHAISEVIKEIQAKYSLTDEKVFDIDIEYVLRQVFGCGVNMLRKLYVSDVLPLKTNEERVEIAKIMGHSLATQVNIYQRFTG